MKQRHTRKDIIETENIHEKLKDFNIPKLNQEESENIEGPITNTEVFNFLKNMKNDKSTGPDGYTS